MTSADVKEHSHRVSSPEKKTADKRTLCAKCLILHSYTMIALVCMHTVKYNSNICRPCGVTTYAAVRHFLLNCSLKIW